MTRDPELSVVLATFNRAETITETLRHLSLQKLDPARFEVIVIDDGSTDNTREVVERWQRQAPFALTYLHHSNHGPGYTQNRGIECARAPLILLMADDIFMSAQALAAHLMMHQEHPEPNYAVLGQVQQSPTLDGSVFLRTWDPFRFSDMAGATELPYYRFWACNISVKRDFVLRYGPFREARGRAGAASHEDPELGYRLSRGGLQILYCPEALGFHHHVVSLERAYQRSFEQGLNFNDFRDRVGQPEIAVAYHVLNRDTIGDHFRVWFSERRKLVGRAERNPLLVVGRHCLRLLAFNAFSVRVLWKPLTALGERQRSVASCMRPALYRGILAQAFFNGVRKGRTFDAPPLTQVKPT
jgi:glycosyltransferase involved in cell wall biosynthesis